MNQAGEERRLTTLAFYGAVLLVAVLAYRIVEPFLMEIGWAVVLAICISPLQARLSRRLGATRSAACLTLVVLFLLIVPVLLVVQMLAAEGAQLVGYVRVHVTDRGGPLGLLHRGWQWVHQRVSFLPSEEDLVQQLATRLGAIATYAATNAGYVIKGAVGLLVSLVITLCVLFFMLKDGPEMARGVRRLLPFGPERNAHMLSLIHDIVTTSVTTTLLNAAAQGLVGGLTFWALGVPAPLFWGCLMAVLGLLPAVGAALVWVPTALWLMLSGHVVKGVVLTLVGILVMGNTDNVLRPLMLSGKSRMSTLVLLISLLGGVSAFGFIGVVLGPVVAAVLTGLVETYALLPEGEPEGLPPTASASGPIGQ